MYEAGKYPCFGVIALNDIISIQIWYKDRTYMPVHYVGQSLHPCYNACILVRQAVPFTIRANRVQTVTVETKTYNPARNQHQQVSR